MADIDLASIIDKQAAGIAKALKMPETKTTSIEKEMSRSKKVREFKTNIFVIIDSYSGAEYASFINLLISNGEKYEVLREVENWTKDGELIRVIDYIETS